MKKVVIIVLVIFLIIVLPLAYFFGKSIYYKSITCDLKELTNLNYYEESNKNLTEKPKVVFLGNSITQDWAAKSPEFFSSNGYLPRGISRQTTSQILLRFRKDVIALQPDIVVINGGINDLTEKTGYDAGYTFGNIVSMAEVAKANHIQVILTSVLPAGRIPHRIDIKDVPEKIESLNEKIKNYAQLNNIPYIDYYSALVDDKKALNPKYTNDELHPTLEGYRLMEPFIKNAIDTLLSKSEK